MAETTSYYNCICTIYKYRLLFPTDKEYTQALGNEFSTVRANKGNEAKIYSYYQILNNHWKECNEDWDLLTLVDSFRKASKLYHTIDWGPRRQMASRKRFMRMFFRIITSGDSNFDLPPKEWRKFNHKDNREEDKRIIQTLISKESNYSLQLEHCFIFLFTFGVIIPIESKYLDSLDLSEKRGQDITEKERIKALARFIEMITLFRDDIKHVGGVWYATLQNLISLLGCDSSEAAPYSLLYPTFIESIYSFLIGKVPGATEPSFDKISPFIIPGIWIDAGCKGVENTKDNRFWIFSTRGLFCFIKCEKEWRINPFELFYFKESYSDNCISGMLCDYDKKLNYLINPANTDILTIYNRFDLHWEYNKEGRELINFHFSTDFYSSKDLMLRRLNKPHPLYNHFKKTLGNLYCIGTDPNIPFLNYINCYIGMDNKYIYVSDLPKPEKWIITENDDEIYSFEPKDNSYNLPNSLLDIEISEDHPLYLIPRKRSRKTYSSKNIYHFIMRLESMDSIDCATIFHIETEDKNDITGEKNFTIKTFLHINFIQFVVELNDDTIKELDIIKITKPFII